jgi:hypothetical protein
VLKIELLDGTHDRSRFDCGVEALNRYFQQIARHHIAKGISKTFALVDEEATAPKPVLGFFTISLCQVLAEQVPAKWARRLPDQIPAMRLGRLAVAKAQQGAGVRQDSSGGSVGSNCACRGSGRCDWLVCRRKG